MIRSPESCETRGTGVTSGSVRWLRGTVVGLVASSLALTGHSLAAGMDLSLLHLAGASAATVPVGVALSGRRWTLPSLLTVLLGAQVAFHLGFAGMSHPGARSMSASMSGSMPGMTGHVASDAAAGGGHGAAVMVLAHVVAALLTALVLRRGEDWCWSLVRLLSRPWRLPLDALRPVATVRSRLGVPLVAHAHDLLLLSGSQPRRGPPVPVR